jgi:hypothetical protein
VEHDTLIEQMAQGFAGGFGQPGGPRPGGQNPGGPNPGGQNPQQGGFARRFGGPGGQGGPGGIFRCYRYGVEYSAFEGKDLTPGEPITAVLARVNPPGAGGPQLPVGERPEPEQTDSEQPDAEQSDPEPEQPEPEQN